MVTPRNRPHAKREGLVTMATGKASHADTRRRVGADPAGAAGRNREGLLTPEAGRRGEQCAAARPSEWSMRCSSMDGRPVVSVMQPEVEVGPKSTARGGTHRMHSAATRRAATALVVSQTHDRRRAKERGNGGWGQDVGSHA